MNDQQVQTGIYEVHSFEVDEFNCIRGVVCGGQTLLEADTGGTAQHLPFDRIFFDNKTRQIYMDLLQHVRTTAETISFPYRCDNETHCIYLRTVIYLSSSRRVGFLNKVTGYDARPPGGHLQRQFVKSDCDYLNCSICNRLKDTASPNAHWQEYQTIVEARQCAPDNTPLRCGFDVCDDCHQAVRQRMGETLRTFERRAA